MKKAFDVSVMRDLGQNLPVRFITYRIKASSADAAKFQVAGATGLKVVSVIPVRKANPVSSGRKTQLAGDFLTWTSLTMFVGMIGLIIWLDKKYGKQE